MYGPPTLLYQPAFGPGDHSHTSPPQRAAELKAEDAAIKERMARNLELGKRAYECGEYPASVRLLEQAVRDVGPDTALGGEAQLWLGLAYQVGVQVLLSRSRT